MTRPARRPTPPEGPEPQVEGDPTDDDIAAVDDASTAPTLGAGHGGPSPFTMTTRIAIVGLGVGVAALLLFEATDAIRSLRRRTSHQLTERWAGIERRERRRARRAVIGEVAALAARSRRQSH